MIFQESEPAVVSVMVAEGWRCRKKDASATLHAAHFTSRAYILHRSLCSSARCVLSCRALHPPSAPQFAAAVRLRSLLHSRQFTARSQLILGMFLLSTFRRGTAAFVSDLVPRPFQLLPTLPADGLHRRARRSAPQQDTHISARVHSTLFSPLHPTSDGAIRLGDTGSAWSQAFFK